MQGENNEFIYSVKVSESTSSECSGIYRHPSFPNELITNFHPKPLNTLWEVFEDAAKEFKDCECLGKRERINNKLGEYKWKTYGEVRNLAVLVGSGLLNLNACPIIKTNDPIVKDARFLGIYMANNPEWTIVDIGCNAYNIVTVSLYDSLGKDSSKFILNQTMMQCIVCDTNCAKKLFETLETCKDIYLKKIILLRDEIEEVTIASSSSSIETRSNSRKGEREPEKGKDKEKEKEQEKGKEKDKREDGAKEDVQKKDTQADTEHNNIKVKENKLNKDVNDVENNPRSIHDEIWKLSKEFNIEIITWEELLEAGKKNKQDIPTGNINTVATICYTSGTTGLPKGVIMKNRNFVAAISGTVLGPLQLPELTLTTKDTHISYLPLAHIYERIFIPTCFVFGLKIGYYSGNIQTLFDDIQVLKPTIFPSVPRLFNRIYDKIYSALKKKSGLMQSLINKGVDQKLKRLNTSGQYKHMVWDKILFNKMKKLLGGQVRFLLTGSAPISVDVLQKLKAFFCVPMLEAFGMTETMGGVFVSCPSDPTAGHIGGPIPNTEFKLVSVPEMDYLVTDNPPKGELYLRGASMCTSGYFKLEKESTECIQPDGFIATGDIVMLNPNGSISIIDRKKNIFKLAQGEYIAVEKIESLYQQSLYISQIFVFGYSYESFLVCIVCPSDDIFDFWRRKHKTSKTNDEILELPEFKKKLMEDLIQTGKDNGLKGYEQIKNVYFTKEPFSMENDLLTPTGKIKRHTTFKRYKAEIDKMYEEVKKEQI